MGGLATPREAVGLVTAQKSIDYCQENGLFETLEEILNVPAIGSATFERIKNSITLDPEE